MAESSDANNMPEGITLVFYSWACTADGSGGFSSHLITTKSPESKATNQSVETCKPAELDRKQAPKFDSDITKHVSTPTRIHESDESDTNSVSENLQFFETLGTYVAYLKSIKRPKILNSQLLDGVDRVS